MVSIFRGQFHLGYSSGSSQWRRLYVVCWNTTSILSAIDRLVYLCLDGFNRNSTTNFSSTPSINWAVYALHSYWNDKIFRIFGICFQLSLPSSCASWLVCNRIDWQKFNSLFKFTARNRKYIDKNYGGLFIFWDRLFGTFEQEDPKDPPIYGLVKPVESYNIFYLQFHSLVTMFRRIKATDGLRNKLAVVFKGPGWSPGKPRLGYYDDIPLVILLLCENSSLENYSLLDWWASELLGPWNFCLEKNLRCLAHCDDFSILSFSHTSLQSILANDDIHRCYIPFIFDEHNGTHPRK